MVSITNRKHSELVRGLPVRWLLMVLALMFLLVAGCSTEEEGNLDDKDQSTAAAAEPAVNEEGIWPVAEVAARVESSVVQVNVKAIQTTPFGSQEAQGLGSGVIYREGGYIITNNHVIEGAREVNVAFADGSVERGEVVGTDPFTDITVVKVDRTDLPAAEFGDSQSLVLGELVVALGSPSGFQSTVTSGVISGLNREVPAQFTGWRQESSLVDLIQTDAAISPGSSGGPLVNADAKVIGINVAHLPPTQTGAVNIGFAIPAHTATDVADQILEKGEADHPYLGVSLVDLTPEISRRFGLSVESGAIVTRVDPNGPASEAGIRPGGVITAIDSENVANTGDLLAALRRYDPGDSVELTVAEGGEARDFTVELGERG